MAFFRFEESPYVPKVLFGFTSLNLSGIFPSCKLDLAGIVFEISLVIWEKAAGKPFLDHLREPWGRTNQVFWLPRPEKKGLKKNDGFKFNFILCFWQLSRSYFLEE